ncbi:MAG: YdbH domain-containing protein [Alphaproteobacteria bacterium]
MRRLVRRAALGTLAVLLVLLVGAVVAWYAVGAGVVERRAIDALRARGIPVTGLTVRSIGLDRAVVTGVTIGDADGVVIGRISVRYALGELIGSRRVERIEVDALRLRAVIGADGQATVPGVRFGGDAADSDPDAPVSLPSLPVGEIAVTDAEIELDTPWTRVTVPLEARVRPAPDGGLAIDGGLRLSSDLGEASIPFTAEIAADGTFEGGVTVEGGRLAWRDVALEDAAGWIAVSGSFDGPTRFDGSLQAARLGWSGGALTDISLVVGGTDRPDWALLRAAAADGGAAVRVDASVDDWNAAAARFRLDVDVEAEHIENVLKMFGAGEGITGMGAVTVLLSGPVAPALAGEPSASGDVELALDSAVLPGLARGIDARLRARLVIDLDGAVLTGDTPWTLGAVPDALGQPVRLTVGPLDGRPQRIALRMADGGPTVTAAAGLGLLGAGLSLAAGLDGTVRRDPAGRWSYEVVRLDLRGAPVTVDGLTVEARGVTLAGAGVGAVARGMLSADLAVSGETAGGIAIADGVVGLTAAVEFDGSAVGVTASDCVSVSAARLAFADTVAAPQGLALCLMPPPDAPMLALTLGDAGPAVDARVTVQPALVALIVGTGGDAVAVDVDLPEMAVSARWTPTAAAPAVDLAARGGGVRVPDLNLVLDGIDATVAVDPAADPPVSAALTGARVRVRGDPAPVVPLRLTGRASVGWDGAATFGGTAIAAGGALTVPFEGRHDADGGRVDFRMAPLSFAPGVRHPADLFPVLAALRDAEVTGTVATTGHVGWGDDASSAAEVRVEDLTIGTPDLAAEGIDAILRADSLAPFNLPPGQSVTVRRVGLGVELDRGTVVFGLSDGDRLAVSDLRFGWAGGTLSTEPFAIRLGDPDSAFTLTARDVDLSRLLEQMPLEGLTVTGRVGGRVPVRLTDDTILIDNGVLETSEPGVIRYVPGGAEAVADADDGGVGLLLNAVRNFHYEGLTMTLNGRTGDELEVGINLRGANPDLYDGYPIVLNVNVSGALDQILRSGLRSITFADEAEDYIRDRAGSR